MGLFNRKKKEEVLELKTKEQRELLNKAIKAGQAKRVYKVLIIDPLVGIKEDYWELSEEQVQKHVNNEGIAYVSCYYENGKPQYAFVAEKLWKNWDKVQEFLTNNPGMPPEDLAKAIAKFGT